MTEIQAKTAKPEKTERAGLNLAIGLFLLLYVVAAVFLDVSFQAEFNSEFIYAFKYLSLPALVIAFALLLLYLKINDKEVRFPERLFYFAALWCMLVLGAGGYVAGYNAKIGEQTVCRIEGRVVEKFTTARRRGLEGHYITVLDPAVVGRPVTVHIPEKEYQAISTGDSYKTEMMRGSLGLLYRKTKSTK